MVSAEKATIVVIAVLLVAVAFVVFQFIGGDEEVELAPVAGEETGRTEQAPVTDILDPVGGAYLEANLAALASDGRLVLIGLLGGRKSPVDLGRLLVKRLRIIGSTLRSRSDEEKERLIASMRERVWPWIASGRVRPVVHAVMPISEAEAAHRLLESNATTGKIVLAVSG